MRVLSIVFLITLTNPLAIAADEPGDPEQWYRQHFASIWADRPGERVDEILEFYADQHTSHAADGSITTQPKEDLFTTSMDEWLADGWTHSELSGLTTDRLNATTVVFKAHWLDHYESGETGNECGWYMANFKDGRWQLTAYAQIDCADGP